MTSQNTSSYLVPWQLFLLMFTVIIAVFINYYIVPVHVPGPMMHPLKYKVITGSFAFLIDLVSCMEKIFVFYFLTTIYVL